MCLYFQLNTSECLFLKHSKHLASGCLCLSFEALRMLLGHFVKDLHFCCSASRCTFILTVLLIWPSWPFCKIPGMVSTFRSTVLFISAVSQHQSRWGFKDYFQHCLGLSASTLIFPKIPTKAQLNIIPGYLQVLAVQLACTGPYTSILLVRLHSNATKSFQSKHNWWWNRVHSPSN